jgi:hypothetical protein
MGDRASARVKALRAFVNSVFAQTHNNRLQRTVRKRPAAEPER